MAPQVPNMARRLREPHCRLSLIKKSGSHTGYTGSPIGDSGSHIRESSSRSESHRAVFDIKEPIIWSKRAVLAQKTIWGLREPSMELKEPCWGLRNRLRRFKDRGLRAELEQIVHKTGETPLVF